MELNIWIIPLSLVTTLGVVIFLLALLMLIFTSQNKKNSFDLTPYECGVMPFSMNSFPTHIHFYVVSIVFLVFDVEIVATLPVVFSGLKEANWIVLWFSISFILTSGLMLELYFGSLDWKY
uniref:NADH-ubiquinone oxidoreductase chain 3 n=2 Tax=Pediculus schaeffi TaxID=240286 RepID=M4W6T9_PEDSC|nr:NADH dehydrogenase subunit 3 [Pediculus schaeffi]